ncbi:MAG: DUF309 domain-containing protein [Elusimicrobia bacterium]|nr:DUF309 domain-containing protein [Elusimicrobiota bacterium]
MASPSAQDLPEDLNWDEIVRQGRALFGRGLYFEAHEFLESAWHQASGERKLCLQGLIQICAAFHKFRTEGPRSPGGRELIAKGLDKISRTEAALGTAGASFVSDIRAALAHDPSEPY